MAYHDGIDSKGRRYRIGLGGKVPAADKKRLEAAKKAGTHGFRKVKKAKPKVAPKKTLTGKKIKSHNKAKAGGGGVGGGGG